MRAVLFLILAISFRATAAVPHSTCFPNTADAADWPVCMIYLHGTLEPSGSGAGTDWETRNRRQLQNLLPTLRNLKCKVAAPVSPLLRKYSFGTVYAWSQKSQSTVSENFKRVHAAAVNEACKGSRMSDKPRIIFGFSNGANATAQFGDLPCEETSGYTLIAHGADGDRRPGKCGNLTNSAPHAMPSDADLAATVSRILAPHAKGAAQGGRPQTAPARN